MLKRKHSGLRRGIRIESRKIHTVRQLPEDSPHPYSTSVAKRFS